MAQATGWTPRVELRGVIPEYYRLPRPLAQPVAPEVSFLGGMLVLGFGLLGRLILAICFLIFSLGQTHSQICADVPARSRLYRRHSQG